MLPGVDGHLVSHAFLERRVRLGDDASMVEQARRELSRWRVRASTLGPASTTRTLLQAGAAPLVTALGFDAPVEVRELPPAVSATLRHGRQVAALVVAPFGERLDPIWRVAVGQALHRGADWCLVFNGTHLRVVDASRLYARRHIEFDLELAIGGRDSFAALWRAASAAALCGASGDERSLHALVADSDRHAAGVCRSLRDGVLTASGSVLGALVAGGEGPARRTTCRFTTASSRR